LDRNKHRIGQKLTQDWTEINTGLDRNKPGLDRNKHRIGQKLTRDWTEINTGLDRNKHRIGQK